MRAGNFATPLSIAASPKASSSFSGISLPCTIWAKITAKCSASETGLPTTASVIMDALAVEIEQPLPENAISVIMSSLTINSSSITSPQVGLFISIVCVESLNLPR